MTDVTSCFELAIQAVPALPDRLMCGRGPGGTLDSRHQAAKEM